jgi:hypothetical protein
MKYGFLIISIIFLISMTSAVPLNGIIEGDGYITESINFDGEGTFVSSPFNYTGENTLSVSGNFSNISINIQTLQGENLGYIKERRKIDLEKPGTKRFEPLDGDKARIVLSGKQSDTIDDINIEKRLNFTKFLFNPFTLMIGTLVFIGLITYRLTEYI